MANTWESRDLPVLRAVVDLFEETGRGPRVGAVAQRTGFDEETVQRALRLLYQEQQGPYLEKALIGGDQIVIVGKPTGHALRVAGQWPSPQDQLERLVAAFEIAAQDESRPEEERSRFKQAGLWMAGALSQVAIGALGGAGGNIITPG